MKTFSYELPREKMQQKGVSALSQSELLQVIIGSGTAGMPVAKIARKVNKVLQLKGIQVGLEDFIPIQGIGSVKASQIIASFELALRLEHQDDSSETSYIEILSDLYADVRMSHKQTLLYAFFDGAGRLIDDRSQTIHSADDGAKAVRILFTEALAQSAVSVRIVLGYENQSLDPSMAELAIAHDAYHTAAHLSIPVKSFVLVGKAGEYSIQEVRYE